MAERARATMDVIDYRQLTKKFSARSSRRSCDASGSGMKWTRCDGACSVMERGVSDTICIQLASTNPAPTWGPGARSFPANIYESEVGQKGGD